MFSKPEFPFILFLAAGVLFAWPLMEIYRQFSPLGRWGYFFLVWGLVVACQLAYSRHLR